MPAEVVQSLWQANQVLMQQSASERQFSGVRQRIMMDAGAQLGLFVAIATLVSLPYLCLLGLFIPTMDSPTANSVVVALFVFPLLVVVGFAALGFSLMRKRLRALQASTAAVPPPNPGAPMRCHVCGGDLAPTAGVAFTRCGYCHADNLTDPRVLASLGTTRHWILGDHANQLQAELSSLGGSFRRAMATMIIAASLALPGSCCCVIPPGYLLDANLAVDPYTEYRYAVVDAPGGLCITFVYEDPAHPGQARFRSSRWEGRGQLARRPLTAVPTVDATAFIGLRVRSSPTNVGPILDVEGRPITNTNTARVQGESEPLKTLESLCLEPGQPSPITSIPLTWNPPQ